ncbi:cell division protein FtsQ/DivIB [Mariniphaga sp.]|uniref:cell division protein FtsQ/DivIB n=1 Tax=Mariniphaga sp. TaxID=1954475 RepID=UPI003563BCFD
MLRKILKLTGYILLTAFIVVTLGFSMRENRHVTCRNIEIEFSEDELIKTSREEVARLIDAADNELVGKELRAINAELIEKEIEKHQAILNAEVFKVVAKDSTSFKGILGVRVKHREPVLRIMSSSGTYYLDKTGEQIPISSSYTANVLVASGYFSEDFAKEQLLPFAMYLEENPFWKAQIEQVYVEQDGNVVLTPLVGDHLIELGNMENCQEKLRNMKVFYEQVLVRNNWDKYQTISVKYKNQVIAKKK